jgi:hypothetical protein
MVDASNTYLQLRTLLKPTFAHRVPERLGHIWIQSVIDSTRAREAIDPSSRLTRERWRILLNARIVPTPGRR